MCYANVDNLHAEITILVGVCFYKIYIDYTGYI